MEVDITQYEVLQGEGFAQMTEPILSFAQKAIWINMECLKRLPNTLYLHFLLFRDTKRLIIKPGLEESLDVVRWCTPSRKLRKIMCKDDFWNDITTLMGWSDRNRYRLLGRFVHGLDWDGLAFDMTRAEVFPYEGINQSTDKVTPACLTWEEHCQNPLVSRFEKDTLITIDKGE